MAQQTSEGAEALLSKVLQADKALRHAQTEFLTGGDEGALTAAITREVDRAFREGEGEDGEAPARLIRMCDLLAELAGAGATKALVRILGHLEPNVRVAAGEALVDVGYERYAEVARAIEATVDKGTDIVALCEVPFLLAELGEPGGVKICLKLLKHEDADVVGAAIEGLAQLGDPTVVKDLERLRNDKRKLTLEDDSPDDASEVTVADLAGEAVDHLRNLAE